MIIRIILSLLCLQTFAAFSQQKSLQIGDSCPDVSLDILNHQISNAKISNYKGKILILDFWATWCGPCIAAMPKIEKLQTKYNDKIQIMPVTYEDKTKVTRFLSNMKKVKAVNIWSAVNDSILVNLFPHNGIPYYVWIDQNGKVIAITDGDLVDEDHINRVLNRAQSQGLPTARTFKNIDLDASLFVPTVKLVNNKKIPIDSIAIKNVFYQSIMTGYQEDFLLANFTPDSTRIAATNATVERLYKLAFYNKMEGINNTMLDFGPKRRIWEVKDTALLILTDSVNFIESMKGLAQGRDWLRKYSFCYELKAPEKWGVDKMHSVMLNELNNFFKEQYGIVGSFEKRKITCLALTRTSNEIKIKSQGGPSDKSLSPYSMILKNMPLNYLSTFLSAYYLNKYEHPIIDETKIKDNIDIELNCDLTDVNEINKELRKYDLQFKETLAELNVIVIRQVSDK